MFSKQSAKARFSKFWSKHGPWSKYGPDFFTLRLYHGFTYVRVPLFYILLALYAFNALYKDIWIDLPWGQENLAFTAKNSIYLLLAIGAFTATWTAIVIDIIKRSKRASGQWANLVKYSVYPIIIAILIAIVPFLQMLEVVIPAPFSLSLLIVYLVLNSLYTTIKEAENLANATYGIEDESE